MALWCRRCSWTSGWCCSVMKSTCQTWTDLVHHALFCYYLVLQSTLYIIIIIIRVTPKIHRIMSQPLTIHMPRAGSGVVRMDLLQKTNWLFIWLFSWRVDDDINKCNLVESFTMLLSVQEHNVLFPFCVRWLSTVVSTELRTRLGSSLNAFSSLERAIHQLILGVSLCHTGLGSAFCRSLIVLCVCWFIASVIYPILLSCVSM